jgi:hypothetical protein
MRRASEHQNMASSFLSLAKLASFATRRLVWALPALAAGLAACEGCRSTREPEGAAAPGAGVVDPGAPTLRLYALTDVAGALEPCGCTRDQLGGLDHLGAWMKQNRAKAPASVLVSAGPLFFMDDKLDLERAAQDRIKALTLAQVFHGLDLAAFAPGTNDWADAPEGLSKLAAATGGAVIGQPPSSVPASAAIVREVGGIKVGFVGWGQPETKQPADVEAAVRRGVDEAERQGASLLVALAAVGRGEAKRIADAVPELTAVVVGSVKSTGDANTSASPIERVGDVLIVQAANHLQTAAVIDVYVRDPVQAGRPIKLADATGIDLARKRAELAGQIDDLHVKLAAWARDPRVAPKDVESRKIDLARLEAESAALVGTSPPPRGSFFRYSMQEVRESLGKDPGIEGQMATYYKAVNDQNRAAFADRVPSPPAAGEASYIGVDVCSKCHPSARAVYDGTSHAQAYATLSSQFKEFNLDCVSCHVTGYARPGGSTVTHVDRLENVQCEVCHGPGSKHAVSPGDPALIVAKPSTSTCLGCHHSPHVEQFDAVAKMQEILGPGHGLPAK